MSEVASLHLWKLGAIQINVEHPYKLVSGNYSPIYINCRKLISSPTFIHFFVSYVDLIIKNNKLEVDVVAGGESAGIPFASFVSNSINIPMVYVRKKAKEHGISSLVEGQLKKDDKVVLIEDLITDAGSKLNFIEAIKNEGADINTVIVVFDREQGGKERLKEMDIKLYSLTNFSSCLKVGEIMKLININELSSINEYLHNPVEWGENKTYDK